MDPLKVFISYRRADTQHVAGRLGDRISKRFTLFMDIDDIPLGVDFTKALNEAVSSSDVIVVLIGQRFFGSLTMPEPRPGQPRDWVVAEVSTALDRGLVVIPVLVDDADMPEEQELPEALWPLRQRQALRLSHASFNTDVDKLVDALTALENRKRVPGPTPPAQPAPSRDALFRDPDYSRAVAAAYRRQWAEAVELFTAVQQRFPTDERVRTPLAEAKASDAEARGQWYESATMLEALAALRPGDQTIQNRLASARREVEIADLIGQLRALAAAEEWAGVVAVSQRIAQLDPQRANPEDLARIASTRLYERDLDNRYSFALAELDRGNLPQAYAGFEAISRERPGYREVDDLLGMIRERLAPAPGPFAPAQPRPDQPRSVAPSPVVASGPAPEASRPLADTGRIWLVVGAMALLVMVAQGGTGGLIIVFLTLGMVVLIASLMVRDSGQLDRPVAIRLRIWSIVAALAGLVLVIPFARILFDLFLYAYKYSANDEYGYWRNLLVILLAQVVISVLWFPLLRGKLGRAAVWPALSYLAGALVTTVIIVGNFDTLVWY